MRAKCGENRGVYEPAVRITVKISATTTLVDAMSLVSFGTVKP